MPHSMQGTRGQVRFRGKNSPKWARKAYDERVKAVVTDLVRQRQELNAQLRAEQSKSLAAVVKARVKGFTARLFGRKTG